MEYGVPLSADSKLVDEIEYSFKKAAVLAADIRNILTTGMGGNPVPLYLHFKKTFEFMFTLSCEHKSICELDINKKIIRWRDAPGLSYKQIQQGLSLFEQYKSHLFAQDILKFN